jgi:hypothetical protein
MKAYSRSKAFRIETIDCKTNAVDDVDEDVDGDKEESGGRIISSDSTIDHHAALSHRLLRRSKALHKLLEEHGSLHVVTDIGRRVFALDVLQGCKD